MIEIRNLKWPTWVTSQRMYRAGVCGLAGWIVSFGLVHWGGPMARHIPDQGVHLAAFWWALVAGFIVASGFGHARWWGWALAGLSALFATVFGAIIAAATMGVLAVGSPSAGALGVIAIADGASSPLLVLTWGVAMVGVDAFARWGAVARIPPVKDIFG